MIITTAQKWLQMAKWYYFIFNAHSMMSIYRNGMFYGRYGVRISIYVNGGFCTGIKIHFLDEWGKRENYLAPESNGIQIVSMIWMKIIFTSTFSFLCVPISVPFFPHKPGRPNSFNIIRKRHGVHCMTNTWLWIIK